MPQQRGGGELGLAALLALAAASIAACPPPADPGDEDAGGQIPGIVRIDGGPDDGRWIVEGLERCPDILRSCSASAVARPMRYDPTTAPSLLRGEVLDGGPGAGAIAYDGGVLAVEWPSVEGRSFAAPRVGETVELRLAWDYPGPGEPDHPSYYAELRSEAGRLLVAQGFFALGSELFDLTELPDGEVCSYTAQLPQCCCTTMSSVMTRVQADEAVDLGRCDEATVELGGEPFFVRIEEALRRDESTCVEAPWYLAAEALGIALVE
ncbi:MAG: hypothetical protein IT382_15540 [Deltaproteobacteria bacterium]|nr:hypothetical protein [Deltaproteobacteria bacterium]